MQKLRKLLGIVKEAVEEDEPLIPSPKEALILQLLLSGAEKFGLALVNESEGELKKGTVYVTLDRMEDKGLISSRKEPRPDGGDGPARRLYKVTAFGQKAYKQRQVLIDSLLPEGVRS